MKYRMGGIYGTFLLGLEQEKLMDSHKESHSAQNMYLREAPLVRYQVET